MDIKRSIFFVALLFVSFSAPCNKPTIVDKLVTTGKRTVSNRNIEAIIVHSTYNISGGDKYDVDKILSQFTRYKVSAHYLIARNGVIYRLVKEKNISFHAGKSCLPDGNKNVNSHSIGIEVVTSKDSLDAPTVKQIDALVALVKDIKSRYKIKYVLRHSDIAPGRKTDPWNMNWEEFLKRIDN